MTQPTVSYSQVSTCGGRTSEQEIPQDLIETSLALTGKTMEDMEEVFEYYATGYDSHRAEYGMSIEKFFYYLLSPEFIEKYELLETDTPFIDKRRDIASEFGLAIFEFQRTDWQFPIGNKEPLIDLLTKI